MPYVCNLCNEEFHQRRSLETHKFEHRARKKLYSCIICYQTYESRSELSNHISKSTNCLERIDLDEDDSSDDPDNPGQFCEQTGKFLSQAAPALNCSSKKSAESMTVTRSKAAAINLLKDCNNKDERIDNVNKILPTSNKSSNTISYGPIKDDNSKLPKSTAETPKTVVQLHNCNLCWRSFDESSQLESHIKEHLSVVEGENEVTGALHISESSLIRSETISKRNKKTVYRCDVCDKYFLSKTSLDDHKLKHTKNYQNCYCDVCKMWFSHRLYLNIHKRHVHEDNPAFSCEVCNTSFIEKSDLILHMKEHIAEENVCYCTRCDMWFSHRLYCNIHKRHVHEAIQSFTCEICRVIFPIKSQLLLHTRIHIEELKDLDLEAEHNESSSRGKRKSNSQYSMNNKSILNSGQSVGGHSQSGGSISQSVGGRSQSGGNIGHSKSSSYQPISNSGQSISSIIQFSDSSTQEISSNSGQSISSIIQFSDSCAQEIISNSGQSISSKIQFSDSCAQEISSNSGQSISSNHSQTINSNSGQLVSSSGQLISSSSQLISSSSQSSSSNSGQTNSWKRTASGEVRYMPYNVERVAVIRGPSYSTNLE